MTQKQQPKIEWGFYAVVPRVVRTQYKNLSHAEKWLYTCLKDLCGDKGTCFRTLRSLSEETDISIGSLSTMIPHLHETGLIHAEKKRRSPKGKEVWHITIADIWQSNHEYCSIFEQAAHDVHFLNKDVQNLNEPTPYRSENEPHCSNFVDRRITHKNSEEYKDEEQESVNVATTPTASSDDEDAHALSSESCSLCSEQEDIQPCRECGTRLCFEHRRDFPDEREPTRILCVTCLQLHNREMVGRTGTDTELVSALGPVSGKAEPLIASTTPTAAPAPPKAAKKPRTPKPSVEAVVTGPAPKPPLPDASMPWGTRKCLLKFDAWREARLIVKHKIIQASECAKALSETYTEEQIDRVYAAMNADAYYIERGGADIFDVASNIAKYLRKLDRKLVAVPSSPPPSGPRPLTDLQARNKALREKYGQPVKKEVITHGA